MLPSDHRLVIPTVLLTVLLATGCTDYFAEQAATPEPDPPAVSVAAEVETPELPEVGLTSAPGDPVDSKPTPHGQQFRKLFESVLPTLDKARRLVDRHDELPEKTRLPFKADQASNNEALNQLLDEAIEMLGISEVSDYRQQIRDTHAAIAEAHAQIAEYRQQRVSAETTREQSRLDKVNPFKLSKDQLDERIEEEQAKIAEHEQQLQALKDSFSTELAQIGLKVDDAGIEALLSSVSGDDIVTMAVVFDNIKQLTLQFQTLTEESGEAVDSAKRYYGMYVVMIRVMDRIQDTFVDDIQQQHLPKLQEFAAQADRNIAEARDLLETRKGDAETLQANIASNQLTKQTAGLYTEYLTRNAELIAAENKAAEANLATAMNTYNTVKLSSDVATLMNTGRRNFETLMQLDIPALREFHNDAIRKEFQRMTVELRTGP